MDATASATNRPGSSPTAPLRSNAVVAMALFMTAEIMLFAGLISAHIAYMADRVGQIWPPLNEPRLPVAETATSTAALVLSGVILGLSNLRFRVEPNQAVTLLGVTALLGGFFVAFQAVQWVGLLQDGLTVTSSVYGAFFHLIVGTHALNAIVALGFLIWAWKRLRAGTLSGSQFLMVQIFWYFVVLLWPVIYFEVYR